MKIARLFLLFFVVAFPEFVATLTGRTCTVMKSRAQQYTVYQSGRRVQRYTVGCGWYGLARCARYRDYYVREPIGRVRTVYYADTVCCRGWRVDSSGTNCNIHDQHPTIVSCPESKVVRATGKMSRITWQKPMFREPFSYGLNITSTYEGEEAQLPWGDTRVIYVATSQNNNKGVLCAFTITVIPAKPKAVITGYGRGESVTVDENQRLVLECRAEYARPPPVLTWFREGARISAGASYRTVPSDYLDYKHAVNTLTLNPTRRDSGVTYECRTTPDVTRYSVKLNVTHEVHPVVSFCPANISRESNTRETLVTWRQPTFVDPRYNETVDVSGSLGPVTQKNFGWGEHRVTYTGTNRRNKLTATCHFTITIQRVAEKKIKCDLPEFALRATYTNWVKTAVQDVQVTRTTLQERRVRLESAIVRFDRHILSFKGRARDIVEIKATYEIYKNAIGRYIRRNARLLKTAITDIEKHLNDGERKLIALKRVLQKVADLLEEWEGKIEKLQTEISMWSTCVRKSVGPSHICAAHSKIVSSLSSLANVSERFSEQLAIALSKILDCRREVIKIYDVFSVLDHVYNTLGLALPRQLPRVLGIWIRAELQTLTLLKHLSKEIAYLLDKLYCLSRHSFQNTLLSVRCSYEGAPPTTRAPETTPTITDLTTAPTTTSQKTTSPTTTSPTTTSPTTTSPTTTSPTTTSPTTTSPTTTSTTTTTPTTTSPTTTTTRTTTTTSTTTTTTTRDSTGSRPVLTIYNNYVVYNDYPRGVDLVVSYGSKFWWVSVVAQVTELNTHKGSGCGFDNSDVIVFPNSVIKEGTAPVKRQCGSKPRNTVYLPSWVNAAFIRLEMRFVASVGKVGGSFKVKFLIGINPKWTISNGGNTLIVDKTSEAFKP